MPWFAKVEKTTGSTGRPILIFQPASSENDNSSENLLKMIEN
jgi:hypothetical protein